MQTALAPTSAKPSSKAGGVPLRMQLKQAERRRKLNSFALALPLLLFMMIAFILPLGKMMLKAVHDDTLNALMPRTTEALSTWEAEGLPEEHVYAALAADLKQLSEHKSVGKVSLRINYELPGAASRISSTARKVASLSSGPYKGALIEINPIWGGRDIWGVLKRGNADYTGFFLLRSVDLEYSADGSIVATPTEKAIFREVLLRTVGISLGVTAATLVLAFPLAYFLATLRDRSRNLLLIIILVPFWTSVLALTSAWVVVLQDYGVINQVLMTLRIISEPTPLIFNRIGTVLAMTHIQLPFTLLPIFSVMKSISPSYVRAARSLGAGPFYAFWKIYFPLTLPGVAAGCLLTFILCLGYYITPALVGGPRDQMVSNFVALFTNQQLNWGMASALGAILLVMTLIIYLVFNKLLGVNKINMG